MTYSSLRVSQRLLILIMKKHGRCVDISKDHLKHSGRNFNSGHSTVLCTCIHVILNKDVHKKKKKNPPLTHSFTHSLTHSLTHLTIVLFGSNLHDGGKIRLLLLEPCPISSITYEDKTCYSEPCPISSITYEDKTCYSEPCPISSVTYEDKTVATLSHVLSVVLHYEDKMKTTFSLDPVYDLNMYITIVLMSGRPLSATLN